MSVSLATGRRKNATARVRLVEGSGKITINGRSLDEYFMTPLQQNAVLAPLQTANAVQKYDVFLNCSGGGSVGQAGAARHAIARALLDKDAELRKSLRDGGHLTRDPRMKERKKPGQPGARARFQFSKR
jgi:small subunit ribosomal protein S9